MKKESLFTRENILYAVGLLISAFLIAPCILILIFRGHDYHLQFVKWWQSEIIDRPINFKDIVVKYYYDVPTVFICKDEFGKQYIFCWLDEDEMTYIGLGVSNYEMLLFLDGEIDLRKLYERKILLTKYGFFIGKWKGKDFSAKVYRGEMNEDMMPAAGLVIMQE